MSNKKDDDYFHKKLPKVLAVDNTPPGDSALVKADGQYKISDRTHLARLGDIVVSKYEVAPNAFASSKDYRVPVRNYVKVVFTSLYDADKKLLVSEAAAAKLIDAANEQYAQVGILLLMKYRKAPAVIKNVNGVVGQSVDLYNGFDSPIFNESVDKTKLVKDKLYLPETRAVLDNADLRTPETDDIEVFFVNTLISHSRPEPVRIAGCAIA